MKIGEYTLITDRTESDVYFAKKLCSKGLGKMTEEEKEQFLSGLKGAYNYTDFNRVEGAIKFVVDEMLSAPQFLKEYAEELGVCWSDAFSVGYDVGLISEIETKPADYWSVEHILTSDEREQYLANASAVAGVFEELPPKYPTSLDKLTHIGANEIEKGIENTYVTFSYNFDEKKKFIEETSKAWFYSGDLYGGEI